MAGALFNILIPTEYHEMHLSQHILCDCSKQIPKHHSYTNQSDVNIYDDGRPNNNLLISMEKVSSVSRIKFYL